MSRILEQSPQQLAARLLEMGHRRAWLVHDPHAGMYRASHPILEPLADFLAADRRDCRGHEALFFEASREAGTLFAAFLHRTARGQAQGGLRHWPYERLEDLVRDGLRLSVGMTRKAAAAGLWWGGGKGIIARAPGDAPRDPLYRRVLYRAYGAFVSSLRGCYVTAEDAGTGPLDMRELHAATRFASCIPPELGGSGDPSQMTAAGVVCAMEAALAHRGRGGLEGTTVVLQGTGQVGSALLPLLFQRRVARVVASELSEERRTALLDAFEGQPLELRAAEPGGCEILSEPCDVLAPCALGGALGPKTIPGLRAAIVCGAANNQLLDDERDGRALLERGITCVPDYIANRMGIVACGNEQYGYVKDDPGVHRHLERDWPDGIFRSTLRVLEAARAAGESPMAAANRWADERAGALHPIWGHRARQIVASLRAGRWEQS